jgi:hypothetical protein
MNEVLHVIGSRYEWARENPSAADWAIWRRGLLLLTSTSEKLPFFEKTQPMVDYPSATNNGNGTTCLPMMYSTGSTMAQHTSTTHCPQQEGECSSATKCTKILSHQTPVMLR